MITRLVICAALLWALGAEMAVGAAGERDQSFEDKFRQLDEIWPTGNSYRTAGGEPGHAYWQQKVDYRITASLDETSRRLTASETIRYKNNSPDTLRFLWLQLDQNRFKQTSVAERSLTFPGGAGSLETPAKISLTDLRRQQYLADAELGYDMLKVKDARGKALDFVVVGTLMRVDLKAPLKPGKSTEFQIDFAFNIVEENAVWARSGFEHFPDDARTGGNDIFLLAQWFPRLAAYTDYKGWTAKEFLGRGEFTLEFGDYDVELTVPADHIVSSTGTLQNPDDVLTEVQRQRLKAARTAKRPVFIVTEEEALENEREGSTDVKTWHFVAENVRDFAWASSRKFMWDAKGYEQDDPAQPFVMAMSFYPKEGGELWKKYSTEAILHTLEVYSRFSFAYPYPVAQSVNGPVGGMEYPMITFNGPRTVLRDDGSRTYSLSEKMFLLGVVFHEIGHIYFPMTVNSDERQWTWMDEGINSFLDRVAKREWDPNMPWGAEPRDITDYMKSENQVPIMTQSDSVLQFGSNAYAKPAAALEILRETIMGRQLFDFAFREYARRWKFKRPTPADFFRTMEEASGVDLDWFWRGWFYGTDHVDISLDNVVKLRMDTKNPDIDFVRHEGELKAEPGSRFTAQNRTEGRTTWVERNPDVRDFYDTNNQFTVTNKERNAFDDYLAGLEDWEREAFERAVRDDQNYYIFEFSNKGGLVMPILLTLTFSDGSTEEVRLPAEIWRYSPHRVRKMLVFDKERELIDVVVDKSLETADVDMSNNYYPRRILPSRIEVYKAKQGNNPARRDIMQDIKEGRNTNPDGKDGP